MRSKPFAVWLAALVLMVAQAAVCASPKKKEVETKGSSSSLAKRIDKILSDPDVERGFWGVEVYSLTSKKELYGRNQDKLFTPASNTKLFTTATAFALIGPDYKFKTTVEVSGPVDKYGRVNGDLFLVGHGDPNLSGRSLPYNLRTERKLPPMKVLDDLADQVYQRGVRYIDGDVIGDDSYFAFERYGEGWAQDDIVGEWGAPVSALTINDNVVFVSVLPADKPGDKAFVNVQPFAEYYKIDNRVMTTPAGTGPRRVYMSREPGANQLTLWGNIPVDDQGENDSLAIEDPAEFAAQAFREMLEKRGIVVYGRTRAKHTELASLSTFSVTTTASAGGGDIPAHPPASLDKLVLATYESQPLSQDIRVINKVSQNLHAEIALRLLGRERGNSGTIESGLEVVRSFLLQAGIRPEEYVFYDGSGLSRQNLVTPEAIVKLLRHIDSQPWSAKFEDTLPVAGTDGSLADRFRGTPAQGRVQAKTGSLGHVNTLSGFATTLDGDRVAFSIMSNNHNLTPKKALEVIDQIVNSVVDDVEKK